MKTAVWTAILVSLTGACRAAEMAEAVPPAAEPEIAGIEEFGGADAARRMLLQNGFVVTDETYRQICSFYIHRSPAFVTTDSVLCAYFLNVEKALQQLEKRQAERLPIFVGQLQRQLDALRETEIEPAADKEGLDPAWRKAAADVRDYLGVALALSEGQTTGEALGKLPPNVEAEIRLIHAADVRTESPLRGVPLDYLRFRPRGFYVGDLGLERFYRAVTWLREVPFCTASEEESRQAVLLARLVASNYGFSQLCRPYVEFLGPSDDVGPEDYERTFSVQSPFMPQFTRDAGQWQKVWDAIKALPPPRHTTILTPEAIENPERYKGMRLLARPSLYDNDLLAPLTPFGLWRPQVSAEELMAVMGSPAAEEVVMNREATEIPGYETLFRKAREAVPEAEKRFSTRVCKARRALYHTLLDEPQDKSLPSYYLAPAWRYKDLNTCLAGWAHHRHLWDLHGKRHAYYGGEILVPVGVVEPNRPFFEAMLELAVVTDAFFEQHDVRAGKFTDLEVLLVDLLAVLKVQLAGRALSEDQEAFLRDYGPRLADVCGFEGNSWLVDERLPDTPFCVPMSVDVFTGQERVVGQARPRALYVIVEREGKRFLTVGGVLSFRDFVGPAQGPDRMTLERWRERAGEFAAPAWQARFAAGYSRDELLEDLRKGVLRKQMFLAPDAAIGDILAEKLVRGDALELVGYGLERPVPRDEAVRLFALTGHPAVVEILFPLLEKPQFHGHGAYSWYYWPEARALEGKLTEQHAVRMKQWLDAGHPNPKLIVGLMATIPGERVERMLLDCADREAEKLGNLRLYVVESLWSGGPPRYYYETLIETALYGLLDRPGLSASRALAARLDTYRRYALRYLVAAVESRWGKTYWDENMEARRPRSFSGEEAEFLEELRPKLTAARARLQEQGLDKTR